MSTIITGLFSDRADAAGAIIALESRGFSSSQLSLIASDGFEKEDFAIDTHSKLPEGVAIGSAGGGAIGALLAGLTAVGAIATGGLGLVVAGPLVASLAGAGVGAATGGILGGIVGMAIPEHEVKHYEDAIERGAVMLGVECENGDQKDIVKDVFDRFEADRVSHA